MSDIATLQHAAAGTVFTIEVESPDGVVSQRETTHNMIPTEGLNHITGVVFKSVTPVAAWYIAPYEGNYTPVPGITAATAPSTATESTAYSESARVLFNTGAVSAGGVDNSANKAEFTFNAAKTIYGVWITSASPKSATTGVIVSFVRFPSPKVCDIGSVLRVSAGFAISSI